MSLIIESSILNDNKMKSAIFRNKISYLSQKFTFIIL